MLRVGQSIFTSNIKLIEFHIMEEHIDAAEVVGSQVDFLPEVPQRHAILAQNLSGFQQQGTRTAGRVVNLIDLGFADRTQTGQQFGYLGRCVELAAALASVGGIHGHQIFVGIAKRINIMVHDAAQSHFTDTVQQLHKPLISSGNGGTQLVAVDIEIIKQADKAFFGGASARRILNVAKHLFQRFVQVLNRPGLSA